MLSNANFYARLEAKTLASGDAPAFETADGELTSYAQLGLGTAAGRNPRTEI